jgi:hypothetical protein
MEFILTESQLLRIIKENKSEGDLTNSLKRMSSFMNNFVNRIGKSYGLNLRMFLTWGTSIAGLVMPLDEFLKTGNFGLTESQRYLVLAGVAFLIFFEGKRGMIKLLNKIKEQGLEEVFDTTLMKGYELKDSFVGFLRSFRIISSQVLEIISYAFLIPIIVDIQNYSTDSVNLSETALMIAERLVASGAILLSKEFLFELIRKLIKKFQ